MKKDLLKIISDSNTIHRVKIRWDRVRTGRLSLYLEHVHENRRERLRLGIMLTLDPSSLAQDTEAVRLAMARRDEAEKSIIDGRGFVSPGRYIMFSEFAARVCAEKKAKNREGYEIAMIHFARLFRDLPLASVGRTEVTKYRLSLANLSPNTRNHYIAAMRHIWDRAIQEGLTTSNPWIGIKKEKTNTQREFLTLAELEAVMAAECDYQAVKNAFLFSCFTGLRWGDIVKLRGSQIRDGYLYYTQSKTGSHERVMLPDVALSLAPRDRFDLPSYGVVREHLKRLICHAGIEKHITFHCARHTFATLQITLGTDIYVVSKLLGHSNVQVTQVYAKLVDQRKDEAMERLGDVLRKK